MTCFCLIKHSFGGKILSPEYMDFVFEIVAYNYGFGWMIQERRVGDTDENVMTIGHGGSINGFNGIFFRTMDDGNFVVLLSNHREMPARNLIYLNPADQIVPTFLAILYNKPYKIPKKSAAYEIARKLMATNDTSVIKAFNDFKNKNFDKFNF